MEFYDLCKLLFVKMIEEIENSENLLNVVKELIKFKVPMNEIIDILEAKEIKKEGSYIVSPLSAATNLSSFSRRISSVIGNEPNDDSLVIELSEDEKEFSAQLLENRLRELDELKRAVAEKEKAFEETISVKEISPNFSASSPLSSSFSLNSEGEGTKALNSSQRFIFSNDMNENVCKNLLLT